MTRTDETWHRLREWTLGQAASERLAAHVIRAEGYTGIDPSHPLGGRDGGRDATAYKDGNRWIMAVFFSRGQVTLRETRAKVIADYAGVHGNPAFGMGSCG